MQSKPKKTSKKTFTVEFILKPGTKSYSRGFLLDPEKRVLDTIWMCIRALSKKFPDIFGGITAKDVKSWQFYFGTIDEFDYLEKLDPRWSLMDLGIFPGSTIAVGPKQCFKK